jgi:TonB family protein
LKFALPLLFCFGALAQEPESPHDILLKVRTLGLSDKTMDQAEPLLEKAVQRWPESDPRNPEYAESLTLLGMIRQVRSETDFQAVRANVEPLYRKALSVYDRSIIPPAPDVLALTLELDAAALNAIGEVQDATPLSERAAVIRAGRVREMQEGAPKISAAYKPGEGISAPTVISKVDPEYTPQARFLRLQGTVMLRLVVDELGRPQDISLVRGIGFGLDENAVRAVRSWRFKPGASEGQPVATIATVELNYRLP